MQNSKLVRILNHFAILGLGMSLLACHLPTPSQNNNSGTAATFAVDLPQPSFTAAPTQNSFGLPTAKTMSAEFCAKDIQFNRIVANHKFIVSGGSADQMVTTNSAGCATWKEDISYNQLATPAFVQLDRTITAKGYQVGSVTASFAINPWQDKIVSLKDSGVPNLVPPEQAQDRLSGAGISRPLWLQNFSVVFSPKQLSSGGTDYSVEISADPKIIMKDLFNQDQITSINQGQFSVKMSLIREQTIGKSPTRSLVAQSNPISVESLTSTQLVTSAVLRAPGGCSLALYYLGVEISAVNGPAGLQDFHGIYQLGPCTSIASRVQPKLLTDGALKNNGAASFSIDNFVHDKSIVNTTANGIVSNSPDSNSDSGVQKSSILIGQIDAKSYSFTKQDSYIKQRRYFLNFCLTNAADRTPIPSQALTVTGISGQSLPAKTFVDGCVSIEDSINFNYYSPECWKKSQIRVQSKDLGLDEMIPVEINALTEGGPFFRDLRFPAQFRDQKNNQCAAGSTQILARGFSLDKVEYDYNVDQYLNLQILKTGYLSIPLTLNRPSLSTSTGVDDLKLPPGTYSLRWAVVDISVKDYTKAAGLIYAAGEKDVEIKSNSVLIDTFTLNLSNIKAIGNTNYILFEVVPKGAEPKNQLSGMQVSTFRAPINLSNNQDGATLETVPMNSVVPQLITQFKLDQQQALQVSKSLSTKEMFAKDNGLKLLNLHSGDNITGHDPYSKGYVVSDPTVGGVYSTYDPYKGQPITYLTNGQLRAWVANGKLENYMIDQLCTYWVRDVLQANLNSGKQSPYYGLDFDVDFETRVIAGCAEEAKKDPRKVFDVEYRYIIQNGSKVANEGGFYRDLTINQAFSLSSSYNFNDSKVLSGDVSAGIRGDYGPLSASAGMRYNFLNLAWTKSKSWGNSINVTSGTPTTVETIGLKVHADNYEKCAVIKMNRDQIYENTESAYKSSMIGSFLHTMFQQKTLQAMSHSLSVEEKLELADRGFMICSGEMSGRPITFDENYYVINQKLPTTQAMDNSAGANRPIFVALRGRGDFVKFVSYVEGTLGVPDAYTADYQQSHLLYDPTMTLFQRGFKSYPGQIIAPH